MKTGELNLKRGQLSISYIYLFISTCKVWKQAVTYLKRGQLSISYIYLFLSTCKVWKQAVTYLKRGQLSISYIYLFISPARSGRRQWPTRREDNSETVIYISSYHLQGLKADKQTTRYLIQNCWQQKVPKIEAVLQWTISNKRLNKSEGYQCN